MPSALSSGPGTAWCPSLTASRVGVDRDFPSRTPTRVEPLVFSPLSRAAFPDWLPAAPRYRRTLCPVSARLAPRACVSRVGGSVFRSRRACVSVSSLTRAPASHPGALRSGRDRARTRGAANVGWCVCGAPVRLHGFRDRAAYREFFRSGLCQDCQDRTFLSFDAASGVSHVLRRGLVVGAQASAGAVAALPFVFTSPGRPIAWEARHCVLVGPEGAPCDPWGDLEALADVLADHQIRVHEADTVTDPHVAECLGAPALVLGPDRAELDACVDALGLRDDSPRIPLGDVFDWTGRCGYRLTPLHRFALRAGFTSWREPEAGALRRCAWLAAALALPVPEANQADTVLDAVLWAFLSSPTEPIP